LNCIIKRLRMILFLFPKQLDKRLDEGRSVFRCPKNRQCY